MPVRWNTSLSKVSRNKVLIRGYRIEDLMESCSFGAERSLPEGFGGGFSRS